jgi:hypothetical protein
MTRTWCIYILRDPHGGVRYVGVTHQTVQKRLSSHLSKARSGAQSHLMNWLRSLLAIGSTPAVAVIETGCGSEWGAAEVRWIKHYRELGAALVNGTDGGEGCPGHLVSAEAREKVSKARLGKPLSPEHRAKVAAGNRGKRMSSEAIAKTAAAWRGRKHTVEARAKISAARTGRKVGSPSAEVLARRTLAIRAALAKKRLGGVLPQCSVETRAKISAANKGRPKSPETRAKISTAIKAYRAASGSKGLRSPKACPLCAKPRHRQSKICRRCYEASLQLTGHLGPRGDELQIGQGVSGLT